MITTWYLHSQRTWDKLCHSCIGSSFLPRGAFPEGRAYAFSQRLHAGSLEALRVSRPEAVVLAFNNYERAPELESGLRSYFWFYDEERPHQSLDYRTPARSIGPGFTGAERGKALTNAGGPSGPPFGVHYSLP